MNRPGSLRRRLLALAFLPFAGMLGDLAAAGGSFEIRNGTIAGGGGTGTADCYALTATVGEAVSGTTSNGEFTLTSGFAATIGNDGEATPVGDQIFRHGFEGTGGCAP